MAFVRYSVGPRAVFGRFIRKQEYLVFDTFECSVPVVAMAPSRLATIVSYSTPRNVHRGKASGHQKYGWNVWEFAFSLADAERFQPVFVQRKYCFRRHIAYFTRRRRLDYARENSKRALQSAEANRVFFLCVEKQEQFQRAIFSKYPQR